MLNLRIALCLFILFTENADANPTGSFFKSSTRRSRVKSASFSNGTIRDVVVSWTANREAGVNNLGGGYKVYYSQSSGFNITTANSVDVPYVSGSQAPTSVTLLHLEQGTWYFRVVAYSGIDGGSVSEPSAEMALVVTP